MPFTCLLSLEAHLEHRRSLTLKSFMKRNRVRFLVRLFSTAQARRFVNIVRVLESCWVFLVYFSVMAGFIWDIDEKGWVQNMASSLLSEGIVCVIELSKGLISRAQNGGGKFAVQALLNWQWKKSILLKMSGSGASNNLHSYRLLCISYLNERRLSGSHWALSHKNGHFVCTVCLPSHRYRRTLK